MPWRANRLGSLSQRSVIRPDQCGCLEELFDEAGTSAGRRVFFEEGTAGLGEELAGAQTQRVAADEDHPGSSRWGWVCCRRRYEPGPSRSTSSDR